MDDGSRMAAHEHPVMQVLASLRPVTNLVVGVDRPGCGERTWVLVKCVSPNSMNNSNCAKSW